MRIPFLVLSAMLAAGGARAQQPARTDSTHQHSDTLTRSPIRLHEVTVTAAPARRQDPVFSTELKQAVLERTPATDAWDLLRQAGGIEIHEQGQGPGFASDASLRGFSSDHSTDIALWIDGVPINEPVNGHAEGYNDWNLLFPQAVSDIAVTRGPSNPVFGNFALAGGVNVRTLERYDGSSLWLDGGSYGRLEGGFMTGRNDDNTGAVLALRGVRDGGPIATGTWDSCTGGSSAPYRRTPRSMPDSSCTPPGGTRPVSSQPGSSRPGTTTWWWTRPTADSSGVRRSG